jgi:LysR family transcriptional regulator, transcriptional activator of the cysJI operon
VNLDHLKVFYMAATKKNFSETAKHMHLSQPTVSLQIQQLESSLNVKLFERTTKSIKLTDFGRVLFDYAAKILQLIDQAKKELYLLSESIHGELNVGASLTTGEYILPYLLGAFAKEYPQVNLLMKTYNSHQIIQQLEDEEIHIGFIEAPIEHEHLYQFPFLSDELVVISSATDPSSFLKGKKFITPHELFSLPIILREPGSGTRQVLEDRLRENQLDPAKLNVVLELGSTESIKATVETGLGISIISESSIQKELKLGTLKKVNIRGINLQRYFYLVYLKNKIIPSTADVFLQFVLKNVDSLLTQSLHSFVKEQNEPQDPVNFIYMI